MSMAQTLRTLLHTLVTPAADGLLLALGEAEVHVSQHRQKLLPGDLLLAIRVEILPDSNVN